MAEEYGEKTEAPTPRRREEAREQGQVARSPDLTAALLLLGFVLLLKGFGQQVLGAMQRLMEELLSAGSLAELSRPDIWPAILRSFSLAAGAVAPLLAGAVVVAVAANVLQVGLVLNPRRIAPNPGILNPARYFSRLFAAEGLVSLLMSLAKVGLVSWAAWSAARSRIDQIVGVQQLDCLQAFALGASIIGGIALRVAVLLLVLAILDYGYQRFKTEQELRMTRQEVKEEMRRMEGDPKIKQRRRQIALQMLSRRLRRDVPTADVVVTNPTEYAVALKYDPATMHAPRVVAKGQGYLAARIRQIAVEHGVPIVERRPLAQALYRLVEVGQEIPEQFYSAVAEILAYVYELTGRLKRTQTTAVAGQT